ncbi:MAG: hypothetical protein IT233_04115 [Bacteroidia bacterium]|nr:hypothetical protein [Bacteroidia bacterium]
MPKLSKDWITEKCIDFEYKKYVLLAYLQEVEKHFEMTQLYPSLSELVDHYLHTKALAEGREQIFRQFPKEASGIDAETMQLKYRQVINDDALMQEITAIVEFSLPKFKDYLREGKKIYDFIEGHIQFSEVGLLPLQTEQGYFFLKGGDGTETNVFEYMLTFYENSEDRFRAIRTRYLRTYPSGFTCTFQNIKSDLLREHPVLPNPATYALESDIPIPVQETFLPVAKRMLVKRLSPPKAA